MLYHKAKRLVNRGMAEFIAKRKIQLRARDRNAAMVLKQAAILYKIAAARLAGALACIDGQAKDGNPYQNQTFALAWLEGWNEQHRQSQNDCYDAIRRPMRRRELKAVPFAGDVSVLM